MKCLIDGDMLVYEVGFASQWVDKETDTLVIRDFEQAAEFLEQRIREIEEECWADEPSTIYLTTGTIVDEVYNRWRAASGLPTLAPVENFRVGVATTKPYKGGRKAAKPFHYANLVAYMISELNVEVSCGVEADDAICIAQSLAKPLTTIICTRDKDLRMVDGLHFGWPCGAQLQFGPTKVDYLGSVSLHNGKLSGTGKAFFFSQLITGDSVDNIPGLPGCGPAAAFKALGNATTEGEMLEAVTELYKSKVVGWKELMLEQGTLLWMLHTVDGEEVVWEEHWKNLRKF